MKHLIALLLLLVSVPTMAKNYDEPIPWDIYVIPHAGVAYSKLNSNEDSWKLGVTGGAGLEVYLLKNVSVNVDIAYAHEGTKEAYHTIDGVESGPYDYRFDYINVDYLIRWYPVRYFSIFTGVMAGSLVNAKSEIDGISTDIKDELHKGTVCIPAGIGLHYKNWTLDGKFYFPINKLPKTEKAKTILNSNSREVCLTVTLGYKIQLF